MYWFSKFCAEFFGYCAIMFRLFYIISIPILFSALWIFFKYKFVLHFPFTTYLNVTNCTTVCASRLQNECDLDITVAWSSQTKRL